MSASPAGTDSHDHQARQLSSAWRPALILLSLALGSLLHASSCSSRAEDDESTLQTGADAESEDGDSEDGDSNDKGDEKADQNGAKPVAVGTTDGEFPHPKRPTAWYTRTLVTTTTQPPADKLSACIEQTAAAAAEAGNQDDLATAPAALKTLVAADTATYHFCFYQLVSRLDERLNLGGPVMTDLATVFFDQMKGLWILARALDQVTGDARYFSYLRQRYLQLSRDYFGREVQVVAPPLGER